MENQTVTQMRQAAGSAAATPHAYRAWCLAQAHTLLRAPTLDRADCERLAGVLQALEACEHADQLLIVPLDRWTLFTAAEQELAELWSRYERATGTGAQSG
jgi:hypothetical protein